MKNDVNDGEARVGDILGEYEKSLEAYINGAGESALVQADSLAREAITAGADVLQLAAIHHRAMMILLVGTLDCAATEEEVRSVGTFCASCPAWLQSREGKSEAGQVLEKLFVTGLSAFAADHRSLKENNSVLRRLAEVREAESRRIAHALHDEASQLLATVHIALEDVARDIAEPVRGRIKDIRNLLDRVEDELRRIAHELRPTVLENLELPAALDILAKGVSDRAKIPISVQCSMALRLPPVAELALYRAVGEALSNVVRHAHASRVIVQVQQLDRCVRCSVQDDGKGFDLENVLSRKEGQGIGIIGIRERLTACGGKLSINSRPGHGTELVATIPVCEGGHGLSLAG